MCHFFLFLQKQSDNITRTKIRKHQAEAWPLLLNGPFYCGYMLTSSTILTSSRSGAHSLALLVTPFLHVKFIRLSLLLGNFLVQRCVGTRVHRHTCVHVWAEQLPGRGGAVTVCLLEWTVFAQFQSRCEISICCGFFYPLNQIYCENMCRMWWWFFAFLFLSVGSWIFLCFICLWASTRRFIVINSFYAPLLVSFSITFFFNLLLLFIDVQPCKPTFNNHYVKMKHPLENIWQKISVH